MLKEVFRTEPIKFNKNATELWGVYSLSCTPHPYNNGDFSIIMHGVFKTNTYQGADFWGRRYHSNTGKLIPPEWDLLGLENTPGNTTAEKVLTTTYITTSRSGKFWGARQADGMLWPLHYGNILTVLEGEDEPKPKDPFWVIDGPAITHHHWIDPITGIYGPNLFLPGGSFCIDDLFKDGGIFLTEGGGRVAAGIHSIVAFNWTSGKYYWDLPVGGAIVAMALEDATRMYVLFENREVVLIDYERGEVLGAAKIPPLSTGDPSGGNSGLNVVFDGVRMTWDRTYRRLLIAELTPNSEDGQCTVRARGYRVVPEPVYITQPIPLKVPRQGRTVPVLIQVVGDMAEGVGGYVVNTKVTGSGSLVGLPITDYKGSTIIQVACEGSPNFSASSEFDWSQTGSPEATPPHTGLVEIEAMVRVYAPDPADITVSGAPGPAPDTGWAGSPSQPGQPTGGTGDDTVAGNLPATAPNMKYILDALFAEKDWDFSESNQQNPNGRGQFCHEGVQRIHDVDARFGHIDKHRATWYHNTGGRGHAVDALNFKCDDGVTAEIYDIAGGKADSKPSWHFWKRLEENRDKWFYPCPL